MKVKLSEIRFGERFSFMSDEVLKLVSLYHDKSSYYTLCDNEPHDVQWWGTDGNILVDAIDRYYISVGVGNLRIGDIVSNTSDGEKPMEYVGKGEYEYYFRKDGKIYTGIHNFYYLVERKNGG